MKKIFSIVLFVITVMACEKEDFGEVVHHNDFLFSQHGLFVINEGNFSHSNGSISFFSFDSSKVYHHIFLNSNSRPPGDVPNHMAFGDSMALIVVNNASKVEMVDPKTFISKGSLQVGPSPRQVLIAGSKAYVSDLYSDSLTVINTDEMKISNKIGIGRSSESMVMAGSRLFAANWSKLAHPQRENNQVIVVDTRTDQVVDSIVVAKEPNSMVVDRDGYVWVLSSGGYENEEAPALTRVDPETLQIVSTFIFDNHQSNPVELTANFAADTLFWLNSGMYAMATTAEYLPTAPAIAEEDHLFYSLAVTADNYLLSDAIDYQQRGVINIYDNNYRYDTAFRAGIIPGFMLPVKP